MYTDKPACRDVRYQTRLMSVEAFVRLFAGREISAEAISSQMPGFYTVEVVVGLLGELKAAGVY